MRFFSIIRKSAICLLFLLSACASLTLPPETGTNAPLGEHSYVLSGRIGVIHNKNSFSGFLTWRHRRNEDVVLILSPLGQGVARIERSNSGVTLETADGKKWVAASTDVLTRRILGWPLPLEGLHYWVMGQPAPGHVLTRFDHEGHLVHLEQQGWVVDYTGYRRQGGMMLPSSMILTCPEVRVKLIIDRWAPA